MKLGKEVLRELSKLADNERTILSIYLDTRKDWDSALDFVKKEGNRLVVLLNDNEKGFFETSLSFFYDEIKMLKAKGVKTSGLAFFTDLGAAYKKVLLLDVAPDPLVAVDDEAILHPLALMLDEYEQVGIIMVDGSGARVLIAAGEVVFDAASLRTKIHHLSKVGGWSQMRYQRRRDKQIQQFSRQVIENAYRIFTKENVQRIVIAGRDRMINALENELPPEFQKRIIAKIRWDLDGNDKDFVDKIKPLMIQAEREQESALLKRLQSELRRDGLAIAGLKQIKTALENGQVDTLFISMKLDKTLTEELTSKAEATSAYVEFVPDENPILHELEGTAALLRFKIDRI